MAASITEPARGQPGRGGLARLNEARIAAVAGIAIGLHLVLLLLPVGDNARQAPLWLATILGGVPLLWSLGRRLVRLEAGADLLAGVSIVAAILTDEYLVAVIIILMLSGGGALEGYAAGRAKSALDALHRRTPRIAHKASESGLVDVPLEEIAVGDRLVILPHETAPVDGTVVEGHSRMDESFLTGEPFEISKTPGAMVISGAVNGEQALVITADKLPSESRHAQIVRALEAAEKDRPAMRRIGDRLGLWYTVLALGLAAAAWAWSGEAERFLAVTVIATPCPLLIGIPVAVISAVSLAARRGIIVKVPAKLEEIDKCRTLIFDKTGTLTYGRPVLTDVLCSEGYSREEVLRRAASLEQYSKHPLASALLQAAGEEGLPLMAPSSISEKPGTGLQGHVDGTIVHITGRSKVQGFDLPPAATGLECLVLFDGALAAVLRFRDEPRSESQPFISHLRPRHGVVRAVLLSGDREEEVQHLAKRVGISEVYSGKSPEDKVEIVKRAVAASPTLFVGDGINDAPAMMTATVGVALGTHSDVTSEAADAVVLDSSLEKTDELIHIGRRMRRIALQSAMGGMALSMIGMGMAAAGLLAPVVGAIGQEVIDLLAVLNALRVSIYPSRRRLADF